MLPRRMLGNAQVLCSRNMRCRIALAFSNSFLRCALRFLPDRLMNICTILIAEPSPSGETSLRAMMRATSSPDLVNVPGGGKVETVLISRDHLRDLVLLLARGVCLL